MELWHLINRGVERRSIVADDKDRIRFIHDLYAFNNVNRVDHIAQPSRDSHDFTQKRDPLVRVHAYCLMNNHYHLLVSEIHDRGISAFMQKLNMGYAKYFNERHGRTAGLWQGKYKKVHVARDVHFLYVPHYIHLNPLDYSHPEWRKGTVHNPTFAMKKLNEYRWSSHLDYLGVPNFPSLIDTSVLKELFGPPKRYTKQIAGVLSSRIHAEGSLLYELN